MKSYFSDRQQCFRVNNNFISWKKMITGVPNVSILRPLLFYNFINDLFPFVSRSYLSNYADENTLHASGINLEEVMKILRTDFDAITRLLYDGLMSCVSVRC